jgi:hypothetical protein
MIGKTPKGKEFTNVINDFNNVNQQQAASIPKVYSNYDPTPKPENVEKYDNKYHCNYCPYYCYYKLYFSKSDRKIYIGCKCANGNSFHSEMLTLEDFCKRRETKFVNSLNFCGDCKAEKKFANEEFFLCTNCNYSICNNCKMNKHNKEHLNFLINRKDIFNNNCIIHMLPLIIFCKKCKKPFCLQCKCEHDDFDKRDIKAFLLKENEIDVIRKKLHEKQKFVRSLENEVHKFKNHNNYNEIKNSYDNYKNNNNLIADFVNEYLEYFLIKTAKKFEVYEITQNLYNIVKFLHLQLPKEYNKSGNDDFNTLNNFINSRSSYIVIMDKKE